MIVDRRDLNSAFAYITDLLLSKHAGASRLQMQAAARIDHNTDRCIIEVRSVVLNLGETAHIDVASVAHDEQLLVNMFDHAVRGCVERRVASETRCTVHEDCRESVKMAAECRKYTRHQARLRVASETRLK